MPTFEQESFINSNEKKSLILAVAGSGKTYTISKKVSHLLKSGVLPSQIVVFTYTEKAAEEVKERIRKSVKQELGNMHGMSEMYIGTIHAFCLDYLKKFVFKYLNFEIIDNTRLTIFVAKNSYNLQLNNIMYFYKNKRSSPIGNPFKDIYNYKLVEKEGYYEDKLGLIKVILFTMSKIKQDLIDRSKISPDLLYSMSKLDELLEESKYIDFSSVLYIFYENLKNHEGLKKYFKENIKYLIVDEFQDVNEIQNRIIQDIGALDVNLIAVGDDDQAIFSFQGSNPKYIREMAEEGDFSVFKLTKNFRSTDGIITLSKEIINQSADVNRIEKTMIPSDSKKSGTNDILLKSYESDTENLEEKEAKYIVDNIESLIGTPYKDDENSDERGINYKDIAVLVRSWYLSKNIVDELEDRGIPFVVKGLNFLLEKNEIKASIGIFKYIQDFFDNKNDKTELKNLWKNAANKIEEEKLELAIYNLDDYLDKVVNYGKSENQKNINKRNIKKYHIDKFQFQKIFRDFIKNIDLKEELFTGKSKNNISYGELCLYNLGMFSTVIQDFEYIHYNSRPDKKIKNFVKHLNEYIHSTYPEGVLSNQYQTVNAVTISTIHSAKGLEWPAVFIAHIEDKKFPSSIKNVKNYNGFLNSHPDSNEEKKANYIEEQRLFYVAITRAKKFLHITYVKNKKTNPIFIDNITLAIANNKILNNCILFNDGNEYIYNNGVKCDLKNHLDHEKINLNYTLIQPYIRCPMLFKNEQIYKFNEPLNSRIGLGKSIHSILQVIHNELLNGKEFNSIDFNKIIYENTFFPYLSKESKIYNDLLETVIATVNSYSETLKDSYRDIEFVEKDIFFDLDLGVSVSGRIDLIQKKNNGIIDEITIIDIKSRFDYSKESDVKNQLLMYSKGYYELSGQMPSYIQIYDLSKDFKILPKSQVTQKLINKTLEYVENLSNSVRNNSFECSCGGKYCKF